MRLTLTHFMVVALLILGSTTVYLLKRNDELKTNIADRDITIKSMALGVQEYKAKDGTWNQRLINERQSTEQLKNSKDSIIQKMTAQLANANIKLNNALALGYVKQDIEIDTEIKYQPKPKADIAKIDTLLDFSKPPHIVNTVRLTDTSAFNRLVITNEQILMTNAKKEFVNERKKFFLWRWFQKRHWVVYTDIHNSNPYIRTKESKFITIVEKNGETKDIK